MAIREIIIYPQKELREISKPVESIDEEIRTLLSDLAETMYQAPGIGLAAPQVGVTKRVIVVDVGPLLEENQPNPGLLKIVNPQILEKSGLSTFEEGCLSLPQLMEVIERPAQIKLRYTNEEGKEVEMAAEGILATALQHEIDHLDGILILDHISPLKRSRYKSWLKKEIKRKASEKDGVKI